MSDFIHLHTHTHYSILDAMTLPEELIQAAKDDGQESIALTDHGVMFGVIDFYNKCKKAKIKPIIGCESYIASGSRFEKTAMQRQNKMSGEINYFHLLLLAKNEIGYHNLIKLSSIGHTEGFYARPRIDKEVLAQCSEGLICTSACRSGSIPKYLLRNEPEAAKKEALFYKELFGDDFYIEIQNHHYDDDEWLTEELVKLARELDIKIVATQDIHYLKKEDAVAHNIFLAIRGKVSANKGRGKENGELGMEIQANGNTEFNISKLAYKTPEFYFTTQEQMKKLFADYPDAITNTIEIANKCNLELDTERETIDVMHPPVFPIPEGYNTEGEYLEEIVWKGVAKRYDTITDEIRERVKYELDVMHKMKFDGYFLIVWDFVRAAKELGVGVGPGRGSAAGSIVAYSLGITNVEPLRYNLLFERFLNPERKSMPDVDMDFNDRTRARVFEYVRDKYGEKNVSQIITFSTLSAKAVVKDVGRVLGVPLKTVNKITKSIDMFPAKTIGASEWESIKKNTTLLQYNLSDTPVYNHDLDWLREEIKEDTEEGRQLAELIKYSLMLENRNRGTGTHAAGVVIAPSNVSDFVPLYKMEESDDKPVQNVCQYEMSCIEKGAGLIKMDFLGLTTLSILEDCLNNIKQNYGIEIDLDAIDFRDQEVYKLFCIGQTKAVFQFESAGMQKYMQMLKPDNLEDLIAMNALYRPGPMANIPSFIARKHGKEEVKYLHPLMKKSLETTFGIIVYQEQVMQLVQDLAGFSLGEADIIRRAMGKKKKEAIEKKKLQFLEGTAKNGIPAELADEIYELILKFADYGFNKSHALVYSYLAYQTMWLKKYYPAEFLAAAMSAAMLHGNKALQAFINEANKFNIAVLAPDVNVSGLLFSAKDKNSIVYGLSAISGVGTKIVEEILEARKDEPFISIFDFAVRVTKCSKKVLEALISSGAFDSIYGMESRSMLFASIEMVLEFAKKVEKTKNNTMDALFGSIEDTSDSIYGIKEPLLIFTPEWGLQERLNIEHSVLNFYVTGNPLDQQKVAISTLSSVDITDYSNSSNEEDENEEQTAIDNNFSEMGILCGMLKDVSKTKKTKKGRPYATATLQNYEGTAKLTIWSNVCATRDDELKSDFAEKFNNDAVVCVKGKIEKTDGKTECVVEKIYYNFADVVSAECDHIDVFIGTKDYKEEFTKLKVYLAKHKSNVREPRRIVFHIEGNNGSIQKLEVPILLNYSIEFLEFLTNTFQDSDAQVKIAIKTTNNTRKKWNKNF